VPVYAAVLLLSLLSVATTAGGVALALWTGRRARAVAGGIGFSAGIMIVIALFDLLPEAASDTGLLDTTLAAGLGGAAFWTAHRLIPHTHLIRETGVADSVAVRSVYLVVFGVILHDVPEGFAMANGYMASPQLGVLLAVAIALHNLPEEYAIAAPASTLHSRRFLYAAALLSAAAEPVGAIVGLALADVWPALNPVMLAFAAGAMVFVSVHELLPLARRYGHPRLVAGGMGLSLAAYLLLVVVTRTLTGPAGVP
jgi:ZIP family zinc transporter